MLGVLQTTPQSVIVAQSLGNVSFAQLFRQTDVYRGRVVNIQGTVRRAESITPRENENNIDQLFRWIVEPSGPSNAPIVVYSIEKPTEFMIGNDLREEVSFSAICFKRWAYAAGDGTRIAPLLLAKTATWQPEPPPKPIQLPSFPVVLAMLLGLSGIAVGIAAMVYRSSVATSPDVERLRRPLDRVDELNDNEVLPTVSEALQQMSEQARHAGSESKGDR
jgi:hypothetical protein